MTAGAGAALRVLVLAGTSEARELCAALRCEAGLSARASLAGRTATPATLAVATRHGGFGGVDGLIEYLRAQRIDALVDATHPYAVRISANAAHAAQHLGVAHLRLERAPWKAVAGDLWTVVDDLRTASARLAQFGQRAFLALGHQHLASFAERATAAELSFVVRSVEAPPRPLPLPRCEWITARGPFTLAAERELLRSRGIDVLVSRNSGGTATRAKIDAARELRLPVLMLARPTPRGGTLAHGVADTLAWLRTLRSAARTT